MLSATIALLAVNALPALGRETAPSFDAHLLRREGDPAAGHEERKDHELEPGKHNEKIERQAEWAERIERHHMLSIRAPGQAGPGTIIDASSHTDSGSQRSFRCLVPGERPPEWKGDAQKGEAIEKYVQAIIDDPTKMNKIADSLKTMDEDAKKYYTDLSAYCAKNPWNPTKPFEFGRQSVDKKAPDFLTYPNADQQQQAKCFPEAAFAGAAKVVVFYTGYYKVSEKVFIDEKQTKFAEETAHKAHTVTMPETTLGQEMRETKCFGGSSVVWGEVSAAFAYAASSLGAVPRVPVVLDAVGLKTSMGSDGKEKRDDEGHHGEGHGKIDNRYEINPTSVFCKDELPSLHKGQTSTAIKFVLIRTESAHKTLLEMIGEQGGLSVKDCDPESEKVDTPCSHTSEQMKEMCENGHLLPKARDRTAARSGTKEMDRSGSKEMA